MSMLGSLSNRLFFVCVLLSTASSGAAMLFVSVRLTREHDRALALRLDETITLVERQRRLGLEASTRLARLVADLPKLKAALATGDAATVAPIVSSYRDEIGADVLIVSEADGRPLFTAGDVRGDVASRRWAPATVPPSPGPAYVTLPHPRGVLQLVSVPIVIGFDPVERLGVLSVGLLLDDAQARQLRASTGSELAFGTGQRVLASSLGREAHDALADTMGGQDAGVIDVRRVRYAWHRYALQPLPASGPGATPGVVDPQAMPQLIVLHSTAEAEATLRSVRIALAVIAVLTALVASLASYGVARTITRPLAGLTASMREMTRTGDLSRRPHQVSGHAWDDEDVRVLAGTFDTLTDAIHRFQQQAAQRDRLTALGRLSTVIAHEIRNPLMIVRGALRGLRRQDDPAVVDAAVDIEEQVQRLDRVVNDVLDFARPLQFEVVAASLHAICRDAVTACTTAEPGPAVGLALDDRADALRTDPDRLRTVLVNLIANARAAVREADPPTTIDPPVVVRAMPTAGGVRIEVVDHGRGIAAKVAGQVFEPYVTTRRTGTGLGLAIARNIVDGLGGTIVLEGEPGGPTVARIVLPRPQEAEA